MMVLAAKPFKPKCAGGNYTECDKCPRAGCKRDVYFCRDAYLCLPSGQDISCKMFSLNSERCTHGGGVSCGAWNKRSSQMIEADTLGWQRRLARARA